MSKEKEHYDWQHAHTGRGHDPGKVGGKAYFISQGDPVNLWDWVNELLKLNNIPPITRAISEKVAWSIACACEGFSKLFGYRFEPLLTRILVHEMATDHFFDITRAKEDLGYQPSCTIAEAMQKTFGGLMGSKTALNLR